VPVNQGNRNELTRKDGESATRGPWQGSLRRL